VEVISVNIATQRTSVWFYVWSILIILGCCWAFLQWNHPLAERARTNLETVVQQPVNWNVLTDWYGKYVDSTPVLAPDTATQNHKNVRQVSGTLVSFQSPMSGEVWFPFSEAREGVVVRSDSDGTVRSVADGRVVHVGAMTGIGQTVILQHTDGVQSWYGLLEKTELEKNDWVTSGEVVGQGSTDFSGHGSFVFLAVKEGERFFDPADVMEIE
jgi:stage IV sporulation protein FA